MPRISIKISVQILHIAKKKTPPGTGKPRRLAFLTRNARFPSLAALIPSSHSANTSCKPQLCYSFLFLVLLQHLTHDLDVILESLWQQRPEAETEEGDVGGPVVRVKVLLHCVRASHVRIHTPQDRSASLEESLVQLVTRESLGKLHPVVEAASPSVELQAHLLESFPVALPLKAVALLNGCTCLLHTARLEELRTVELAW